MASSSALHLLVAVVLLLSTPSSAAHSRHPHAHHHKHKANATSPSTPIHQACRAALSPDVCESVLSQLSISLPPDPSGSDVALAALSAASRGHQTARSNAQSILDAAGSDRNRSTAARNCLELLSLSDHRISAAIKALPAGALADSRTFSGAAELYQYACRAGLTKVNDTQIVVDAMAFLERLTNLTTSATAMVAALQRYGPDTSRWGPPQTERDGYWPDAAAAGSGSGGGKARKSFPRPGAPADATVCKGSECRYRSVQAAVDAAPENSTRPFVIHIKEGVYEETVRVPFEKTNLVFFGDGMGKTVITGSLSADMVGVSTYNTATVGVTGDGFMARDLTMANTAGPDAHQAVAYRSDSDLSVLEHVEFLGHQDTLYASSLRQFYQSCRVSGTVDFIFGNAAAVFRDCSILVVPRQLDPEHGETNTVTAHGRSDPAQSTGFVFDRCVVNGSDEYLALYKSNPAVHLTYLGRPWKEYSRTVFIDCSMGEIVRPEGWTPWSGDFALPTLYFGESGSSGPGGKATARVPWSSKIPAEHLGAYSLESFIQGDQWIPDDSEHKN
ncbi:probable pectinesterase/pectinesterase inhibitor 51 [Musa acuminata AAA Group]|uniref:probable pectinesterase/pectinesterase inhibitor 51 n=1 Tax=Musa acuminata AAA Group TaxID=214697 RepID=UPI0031D9A7C8